MPHIAVARLWFEGNSFPSTLSGAATLHSREWGAGPAMLARYAGTATELGGPAAFLETRPDWRATILRCASAQPGGPLTQGAFAARLDEVLAGLANGGPLGWRVSFAARRLCCGA